MIFQQFQNGQHDVVDVAKPTGLHFLRMMETSRPIDRYVGQAMVEFDRTIDGTSRVRRTKIVQTIKHRTIRKLTHIEFLHLIKRRWKKQ